MPLPTHNCTLKQNDSHIDNLKWYQKYKLICLDNPLRLSYFRSDVSVREEQQRHLRVNRFTIHPFSKIRAWYDVYRMYLYSSVLLTKPMDTAFMKILSEHNVASYRYYTIFTDVLCWIDIIFNFFSGMEIPGSKVIELRRTKIARNYILSPFFLLDIVSSVPKGMLYYLPKRSIPVLTFKKYLGTVDIMSLMKIVRIVTLIKCVKRSAEYFSVASKGTIFLLCSLVVSSMIIHWMSCLQFTIPKLFRRILTNTPQNTSWFYDADEQYNLYTKNVFLQYTHCLFKSSAYILGIRIDLYKMSLPEEYLMAVITYFIGKILIAFIWIILAVAILNSRLMDIKFLEIMNQLEEYMQQKQLPLNLRQRIVRYFVFKYRNKFFKENLVNSLLSENLRREVSLHVCKSLVKNVSLFCELSPLELNKVVNYLIPEIFLPNDVIIHAGTFGDAMFFLSSGTVAVYTRSGKEICHLQDGAYFGEIALVLKGQLRLATVIALETTQVYRLKRRDLERCLLTNKTIKVKILREAENRLQQTAKLEEEYKELLYEQSFKQITTVSTDQSEI